MHGLGSVLLFLLSLVHFFTGDQKLTTHFVDPFGQLFIHNWTTSFLGSGHDLRWIRMHTPGHLIVAAVCGTMFCIHFQPRGTFTPTINVRS